MAPHVLRDGHKIPQLGFSLPMDGCRGGGPDPGGPVARLADRHRGGGLGDERGVARASRHSGDSRDDLFLTSKIPGRDRGRASVHRSLGRPSHVWAPTTSSALYLIHWPNPGVDQYVQTWQEMLAARDEGLVRP
ncbi:hypothetical protein QJS66_06670 [Kocuria rhizophila]|nr:hypothetical protein QJS66_06670 [Kocuria rhizophila]